MEKIDLHLHTNVSDGILSPEEVIRESKNKGCSLIAITDHEIVKDYQELGFTYGIDVIPGIEFNSSVQNMHILGYGMNDINRVTKFMNELRIKNEQVCFEVLELLEKGGFDISLSKLKEYLESHNYDSKIIDKRKIVKYLIYKGYVNDVLEAYTRYIGVNKEFYVPNHKISPEKLIELVTSCGGVTALAHPNTINYSDDQLFETVKKLKAYGLAGIEIINKKISSRDTAYYMQIARRLDLLMTVGSDFHDPKNDFLGIEVDEKLKEEFVKRLTLTKKN